ncbi:hypothetical protein E4T56_gene19472 [Termitomyces sp. T112]|nr:hypothetical protein E4T56_gene19472 [Termitomyces sp. T112]
MPSRGILVYEEQPSSLSLTDPVPPKTTRWMNKSFRIGEFKYGRAIECIALIKLKSDPNKFRFLIDTGSCINWLTSDYQSERSRLPGSRGPPYLPTRIYYARPGQYMSGQPNDDQKVYTVEYVDGSWYQYKRHEDRITLDSEFEGQALTQNIMFEFGVLINSYLESNHDAQERSPPKATFHDGMLGFGPTDGHSKMMTVMDSIISEDIIRFPSLTFHVSDKVSSQDEVKYHGTMIFGHPPDYYGEMHGPIPVEEVSGCKNHWIIKSGGKKIGENIHSYNTLVLLDTGAVGIHLHNAVFVDAFHKEIRGATKEYGAWALPLASDSRIPSLMIQLGTGDSPYMEVLPRFLKGEPIRGTNLCWSRLYAWPDSLMSEAQIPQNYDVIGMAAICSLTLMYQFDTSEMTKKYERRKYVDRKGKEVDTHGDHIYWRQSWTQARNPSS